MEGVRRPRRVPGGSARATSELSVDYSLMTGGNLRQSSVLPVPSQDMVIDAARSD